MDPAMLTMLMQAGQGMQGGIGKLFGGLFGNSGAPYEDAMKQFQNYFGQAQGYQKPFWEAGKNAIPDYQEWLQGQKDPSGFINKQMGNYQESPYAKFQQQQGIRAANNMGSASGLTGSTPLMQFAQQNAQDISSKDMNSWLQNVLGINTQYGQGLNNLMTGGQNSANSMSQLQAMLGQLMGQGAFGKRAGENQDRNDVIGGLLKLFMGG
jgi:hypothetical protein